MTTLTAKAPDFAETWARYEAACDDLESARRTAAEARACANEDRRALKDIEGGYVSAGIDGANKEIRDANLQQLLSDDEDYKSIANALKEHEATALDAEIAAEGGSYWLRGALRLMDHINATLGVQRGG